jgi:acetyltransferase-like isoleucine patch superfamily enzyme
VSAISSRSPIEDPLNLFGKGVTKLYSAWVSTSFPFASIGRKFSLHLTCILQRKRACRISIGNSVLLKEYVWLNPADSSCTGEPLIIIDDNCAIGSNSIISAKNRIHLERDVLIAQSVLIQDHNHEYEDPTLPIAAQGINVGGRIRIGKGSWIGHGVAIICPRGELTIGTHCVVGANSVVMKSIPSYSVAFGIPARVIRHFDPVRGAWVVGAPQGAPSVSPEETA